MGIASAATTEPAQQIRRLFGFPNPVDEVAARVVATGVSVMAVAVAGFGLMPVLVPLAYGFVARVAAGPRFSPLGLLATKVVVPSLPFGRRPVPGPPKRFAQAMGAAMSIAAVVAHFGFGATTAARVLAGAIAVAATLEAAFGFCIGCKLFALGIRAGLVPQSVCVACGDLSLRRRAA